MVGGIGRLVVVRCVRDARAHTEACGGKNKKRRAYVGGDERSDDGGGVPAGGHEERLLAGLGLEGEGEGLGVHSEGRNE